MVLDTMMGDTVGPNQAYIDAKGSIAGSQPTMQSGEELPMMDGLGNDGVGARTSRFPREERISKAKSVYEQSDNATDADKAYDATSDAERLTSARERLQVDYDGEKQYLKDTPEWSGEDYAVAKLIQSDMRRQAQASGDFSEFRAWSRDIQKHASFFGQDGVYIPRELKVDYTNGETFVISQMSAGAQKRYNSIKNQFGMDAETYQQAWSIYQNDDLKADQKRQQLSALGYNGSALYKALGQKLG